MNWSLFIEELGRSNENLLIAFGVSSLSAVVSIVLGTILGIAV